MELLKTKSIALIIPDFDFGGEEKRVVYFANNYLKFFKNVYLFSPTGKSQHLLDPKVKHTIINTRNYHNLIKILRILKTEKVDFFQGHKRATLPFLFLAEKLLNIKCNFNFDNIYLDNAITSFLMPNRIYYLSDVMKDFYTPTLSNKQNITINMGGDFYSVHSEENKNIIKNKLNIKEEQFVLLNLGRLSVQKNQQLLLKALNSIKEDNFICLFVGEGPNETELKELAKAYQIEGKVRFLGHRSDVEDLLNISDLLVQSSIFEGFPNVFIEAASVGLPIVSTDVGSSKTLVKNNGILVEPGNSKDLAKSIIEVKNNYKYFRDNAESTRKSPFLKQFQKVEMLKGYLHNYKEQLIS